MNEFNYYMLRCGYEKCKADLMREIYFIATCNEMDKEKAFLVDSILEACWKMKPDNEYFIEESGNE